MSSNSVLEDAELTAYLAHPHAFIMAKLTRKARNELGLVSLETRPA
ncbi:ABC-type uncharacterized transport system substrate-binding protein [Bradyrhizobium sp. USDA 4449]